MKKCLSISAFLIFATMNSCTAVHLEKTADSIPAETKQLIVVTTSDWAATTGMLFMYERNSDKNKWKAVDSFPVNVGRSGMAWDNKTVMKKYGSQKVKHEGDGCSPAGIFSLGPVFSYHELTGFKMPSCQTDGNDLCVDDILSPYYNEFISSDTIPQDEQTWNSFENMKRTDSLYEYGVWINYNADPVIAGSGSCIFLHIWRNDHSPTSGCTSMSRVHMIELIQWLDEKKHPLLMQYVKQIF